MLRLMRRSETLHRTEESISYIYNVNNENISLKYNCSKEIYNKLAIGDTILIVYSLRCPEWNLF